MDLAVVAMVALIGSVGTVQAQMRARQSAKIAELGDALVATGFHGVDQQAKTLGLPRSTCWSIRRSSHKTSGLSAVIIDRMLSTPQLPPLVRICILEYVEEKIAGLYGHNEKQRHRFVAHLKSSPRRAATLPAVKGTNGPDFRFSPCQDLCVWKVRAHVVNREAFAGAGRRPFWAG
jgi:hypothetical protein